MTIPAWVPDAIFYQIFPDRFHNGDPTNDPPVIQPWDRCATSRGFHGGDLEGIRQRLDYLLDLGVNAIYLNPIFLSPSNHRYNTVDYYRIDDKLGTLNDFHALIRDAHAKNLRIILDGVFNHCGRGFFAFSDVMENGPESPYKDWFHIKRFPLDAYTSGDARNYEAWWGFKSLPKFNTSNPRVRRYLLDVARYWIEQGADGWRLDVPNEIDDDTFWAEFRHVVRSANSEAYLVGEIWDALPRWVGESHFDGLMNYPLRTAIVGLLAEHWTPARYLTVIEKLQSVYPHENTFAMLNLLGSHDTERILTMLGGDVTKARLAAMLQFSLPGAPSVYYGDEIGLQGGKDPACRSGFPWDNQFWNQDLRGWYRGLTAARAASPALRRGETRGLLADDTRGLLGLLRLHPEQNLLALFNLNAAAHSLRLPVEAAGWADGQEVSDLLSGRKLAVNGGKLAVEMPAWSGLWLVSPGTSR